MKRFLSLMTAVFLMLSMTACASSEELARLDGILDTLHSIRDLVDALPPDAFAPEPTPDGARAVSYQAEDSGYRRNTKKGTLTVGMVREKDSFDPCVSSFAAGMLLIYDPLFSVDSQGEIRGELAEEWEYQDSTHLYIKIRAATFSNGDAVTAEDCIWSLQRFADSGSRWSNLFDFIDFQESKTISSTELLLVMKENFGPGIRYLATYYSSVLDKDYVASVGEEAFLDQPVGSGPYICAAVEDDSGYTFALREDLPEGEALPEAKTIRILLYDDSADMLSDYESGNLDMAFEADAADAERLLAGELPDTSYVVQPCADIYSLVLPEYVEAFGDLRVRRAIAMAVDWASVREAGLGVLGGEADSVLPDGVPYKVSCGFYEYDPEAATVLLEEAGYDFDQSFEFVIDCSSASIRMAKAIQKDLLTVGIIVHLGVCSAAEAEERYRNGETALALRRLGCPALDPDQLFSDCSSLSEYRAFRIDEEPMPTYLEIGRWSADDDIREECYRSAQSWMYESIREIAIAEPYGCYCYRPYVDSGFRCVSVGMPDLRDVRFTGP